MLYESVGVLMISLLRVIRAISGYSFIILTPFTISAAFSLLLNCFVHVALDHLHIQVFL